MPSSRSLLCSTASFGVETVLQPAAEGAQALPADVLVGLLHELHDAGLEAELLELGAALGHLADEAADVVAGDGEHGLVAVPGAAHDIGQAAGHVAVLVVEDAAGVLGPEDGAAVRRRPAQVAAVHLGHVLVKRRLGRRVLVQHLAQRRQVLAQVLVRQVARRQVLQDRGQARQRRDGEEAGAVLAEEVEQRRDEEACRLLLRREAEELRIQTDDVVLAERGEVSAWGER